MHSKYLLCFFTILTIIGNSFSISSEEPTGATMEKLKTTLQEGFDRFINNNQTVKFNLHSQNSSDVSSVSPSIIVVSCSDFSIPANLLFDQPAGSIYMITNAGNIISQSTLAQLEYAIAKYQCESILVLGHLECAFLDYAANAPRHLEFQEQSYLSSYIKKDAQEHLSSGKSKEEKGSRSYAEIYVIHQLKKIESLNKTDKSAAPVIILGAVADIKNGDPKMIFIDQKSINQTCTEH